jgi:hypothetical protein
VASDGVSEPAPGGERRDVNDLLHRVDALLRRQQEAVGADRDGVPVLVDVAEEAARPAGVVSPEALDRIARDIEMALREQLGVEIEAAIERRLRPVFEEALYAARDALRAELLPRVEQCVRESLAAAGVRSGTDVTEPSE